jgi:hypothetical protein
VQYCSREHVEILRSHSIKISMSRSGEIRGHDVYYRSTERVESEMKSGGNPGTGHLVSEAMSVPEKVLARLIASRAGDLDKFEAISQQ